MGGASVSAIEGAELDPFLANFRRSEELLPLDSSLSPVGGGEGQGWSVPADNVDSLLFFILTEDELVPF